MKDWSIKGKEKVIVAVVVVAAAAAFVHRG